MNVHPDLQRQLSDDRRRQRIAAADHSRLRRDARAVRRQLRKGG